ncbi:hypothetical protein AVEN_222912-1 [Araneus ventricosus]|uniref:Uncharacterized protein n=1 Tax=Araneus ventricosus TaxID=182803 RepID=A0A4Y2LDL5_ARAVE|nr:hypothetical protein AVEN_222912-1 [Araneus ventricosus]
MYFFLLTHKHAERLACDGASEGKESTQPPGNIRIFVIWGLAYKNLSIVAGPRILHTQLPLAPALISLRGNIAALSRPLTAPQKWNFWNRGRKRQSSRSKTYEIWKK